MNIVRPLATLGVPTSHLGRQPAWKAMIFRCSVPLASWSESSSRQARSEHSKFPVFHTWKHHHKRGSLRIHLSHHRSAQTVYHSPVLFIKRSLLPHHGLYPIEKTLVSLLFLECVVSVKHSDIECATCHRSREGHRRYRVETSKHFPGGIGSIQ